MVIGVINHGRRCMKPRAMEFRATGNENYTNTRIYSPQSWHIYFIIYPCVIYIYALE